jgi:hypothetical protein
MPFGQVCLKGAEVLEREPMRANSLFAEPESTDAALLLPRRRRRSETIPPPEQILLDKRERFGVILTQENAIAAAESFRKGLAIDGSDRLACSA